jgi:hypothetical protein
MKGVAFSWRRLRIALLAAILVFVGATHYWEQREVRSWRQPLTIAIYPVNGDASAAVTDYINSLSPVHFQEIADFVETQASRYGVKAASPQLRLGAEINSLPPAPPEDKSNKFAVILWSLKLRYWVYRHGSSWLPSFGVIRLFVVYHVGKPGVALDHSLGLREGLIGVVHAFANPVQDSQNNVVIAHELLHTLGATDKYGPGGLPLFPEGYGDAERVPRYPQQMAEIMAGRVAVSEIRAEIPADLAACVIGYKTAHEINW